MYEALIAAIQPLADRVLIETITETHSHAGIVLPEIAQGRPERGRVLAVGPGRMSKAGERLPMPVEVGDVVVFHRLAGTQVGAFEDAHIIFGEQDLLAKVIDDE
jgi:chaperonin GroES